MIPNVSYLALLHGIFGVKHPFLHLFHSFPLLNIVVNTCPRCPHSTSSTSKVPPLRPTTPAIFRSSMELPQRSSWTKWTLEAVLFTKARAGPRLPSLELQPIMKSIEQCQTLHRTQRRPTNSNLVGLQVQLSVLLTLPMRCPHGVVLA